MKGLVESLKDGGSLVVAEGYMWETERRGFLQFGAFLPEVVIEKPSLVKALHEEFVACGTDVVEAFTYYAYRQQLKRQGKEEMVEKLNTDALRIAREVADDNNKLMAGNISNTPLYVPNDANVHQQIYDMYKEQVIWAVQGGADFIIGETHSSYGEAEIALKVIKEYGQGLPAVMTLCTYFPDCLTDDVPVPEACVRLQNLGASVVGLNCSRGPRSILPLIQKVKEACACPVACLPVPFRTSEKEKTFFSLTDPWTGENVYPANLDCVRCCRGDIRQFAEEAKEIGVQYIGLCCGNAPHLTREIAEVYGKKPPASKYSCDLSKSVVFGKDHSTFEENSRKKLSFMLGKDL